MYLILQNSEINPVFIGPKRNRNPNLNLGKLKNLNKKDFPKFHENIKGILYKKMRPVLKSEKFEGLFGKLKTRKFCTSELVFSPVYIVNMAIFNLNIYNHEI